MRWGYRVEKKSLLRSLSVRYNTGCDRRTRCRNKDRASRASRGQKANRFVIERETILSRALGDL